MRLLLLFGLFLATAQSVAAVSISEVAWMGSVSSANHEWIELYNPGEAVSVDGWTLSDGMNLTITLAGTIPAAAYVVLERNRSDGQFIIQPPFLIYTGALVNTGATLTLRRVDGSVADVVAGGENWQTIGGDNVTKETAQYTSGGWVTAVPTPGQPNTTVSNSSSGSGTAATSITNRAGAGTILTGSTETTIRTTAPIAVPSGLSLQVVLPTYVYAGHPAEFSVVPQGLSTTFLNSLVYTWNFGDLTTGSGATTTHAYQYPGTYTLVVEGSFAKHKALAKQTVTVLPVVLSLSYTDAGDILLSNDALYELDISGYYLRGTKTKKVPAHTYLGARETIIVPWGSLTDRPFGPVVVFDSKRQPYTAGTRQTSSLPEPMPTVAAQTIIRTQSSDTANDTAYPSGFGFASDNEVLDAAVMLADDEEADLILLDEVNEVRTPEPVTATNTWWVYGLFVLLVAGGVMAVLKVDLPQADKTP